MTTANGNGLIKAVRNAREGERNNKLNWAAHKAGQDPDLDVADIAPQLLNAAVDAGLDQREAVQTLKSGLTAGQATAPRVRLPRIAPVALPEPEDRTIHDPSTWDEALIRHPRFHPLAPDTKKATVKWQYPWNAPNRYTEPGKFYGMAVPPGTIILDVDIPDRFDAQGYDVPDSPGFQYTPGGGYHIGYRLHPDRPVPKQKGLKATHGYDTRVGGDGYVAVYPELNSDIVSDPSTWPLAPDWLQPRADEPPEILAANPLGDRTVLDLPFGPPPEPLINPFFTTVSELVLYGPGGVGKGTFACILALAFIAITGLSVMILDYENNAYEWSNRLRGLGEPSTAIQRLQETPGPSTVGVGISNEEALGMIHYRNPYDEDWTIASSTLQEVAEEIKADCNRLNVGLIIVDSIVMASEGGADMGGAKDVKEYFAGLLTVGRRSITLAHVTGAAEKWPPKPFGSIYARNIPRELWAIEQVDVPGASDDPETRSKTFRIELHNTKNSGAAEKPPAIYDVTWFQDGELHIQRVTAHNSPRDQVRSVLSKTPGLKVSEISKAVAEDTGETLPEKAVMNALRKNRDWFTADESSRPFRWSLKP